MKLLIITQKVDINDDDLAFTILWIKEFIKQGFEVKVICLEKGEFDDSFPVYSLRKEENKGKIYRILKFIRLILKLEYDRVFVHMNPEYITLGGIYWYFKNIPIYLWYTHYTMHIHLWISGILCKRMFCATKQSLPQYDNNDKKIITGHGIDIDFWLSEEKENGINQNSAYNLIAVHRLCRSKRLELAIKTLKYLPNDYTLTVYGRKVEKDYWIEIKNLAAKENLNERISFKGPVPMRNLKEIYPKFKLMINMAPETIDKTVLEGMLFGIYPITTEDNSKAIGLPIWPEQDTPQKIAKFILNENWKKFDKRYLKNIVEEKHNLPSLIEKINLYIKNGN